MNVNYLISKKTLITASVLMALGYILFMAVSYGDLPDKISTSFGSSGPRNLTETSFFSWFGFPLVGFGSILYMYFMIWAFSKVSGKALNFPYKDKILKLEQENQEMFFRQVIDFSWRVIHLTSVYLLTLFFYISYQVYQFNTNGSDTISVFIPLLVLTVPYGYLLVRDYLSIKSSFKEKLSEFEVA